MPKHPVVLAVLVLGAAVLIALGKPWFAVLVAALVAYGMLRLGMMMLGSMARPVPEPPPAGELRKVKILYRCSICGTEVRMTIAPHQEPEAPRHCLEDMDLVTPVDDL
jgi:hypothetical protein